MSDQVCVFCLTITGDYVCHECNDYKGLMPVGEAKTYLGEDFPEEFNEYAQTIYRRIRATNFQNRLDVVR